MKKKIFAILTAVMFVVFSVPISASAAYSFSDVTPSDWYYDAVGYVASNGLFNGTSPSAFSPNISMTRGMFLTVLGRLAAVPVTYGRTKSTPFSDVTQADYFFPYVVWALDNDLVTGEGNNALNPSAAIAREQMAAIFFRYAEKSGYDLTYSVGKYYSFSDVFSVSNYAVEAMQWATAHGIINGAGGKLNPRDHASRAQVAQIFLNFSRLEKKPAEPDKPEESSEQDTEEPVNWENYNPVYTLLTGQSETDSDGGFYDYDLANEIMDQINAMRAEYGKDALLYNPKIQVWASVRAQEQTIREGHTRPDGAVYSSVGIGLTFENITIMYNCTASELNNTPALAARAVNSWYTSTKGHKEAMLSHAPNLGSVACYVLGSTVNVVHLFSNRTLYFMDYLIEI